MREQIQTAQRLLGVQYLEFVYENGRTYGDHTYFLPCDQAEQDRLAVQHQVFLQALKGKLTTTPVTHATRRILDLGTGPGDWAAAMAKQYPHADVVGIDMAVWDLETTETASGGASVMWQLDDLDVWNDRTDPDPGEIISRLSSYNPFNDPVQREAAEMEAHRKQRETQSRPQTPALSDAATSIDLSVLEPEAQPGWNFSQSFDLIHLRNMKGSFAYWEEVYAEIYKSLRPGGYVEVVDYEVLAPDMQYSSTSTSADSTDTKYTLPTARKLYSSLLDASFRSGRPLGLFYMHKTFLEDAGFKDVRSMTVNVPIGQWPESEEQKRIGKLFLVVMIESLEPYLLRLLTKYGDRERKWSAEEIRESVEKAKQEMLEPGETGEQDEKLKGWCARFVWVTGRK
ncbi:hypothetical protein M011DRAFT_517292 [Sporormia fimetaria CBS 119925]|uniref:S-adenosyl-L-methionine-dependent methyltransferase n=1 Tax=Sporormia fimetaria CBS 119925 TaxID=1340428 RepID=A0A6A6VHK8_9PLEO|nr:hypothetical protein M011DRAFT_517292 [Sporormia fimetaria CBS 119925]